MLALKKFFGFEKKSIRHVPVRGESFLNPRFLNMHSRITQPMRIRDLFSFLRAAYSHKKVFVKSTARARVSVYSYTPNGLPAVKLKMG